MAKIGTAHVEIKPVLNEEALAEIVGRIEEAVRTGVVAGLGVQSPQLAASRRSAADDELIANVIRSRTKQYRGDSPS